jgi:hypothetical protein
MLHQLVQERGAALTWIKGLRTLGYPPTWILEETELTKLMKGF